MKHPISMDIWVMNVGLFVKRYMQVFTASEVMNPNIDFYYYSALWLHNENDSPAVSEGTHLMLRIHNCFTTFK